MSVPDPRRPLVPPPNVYPLPSGTVLHRVWHERYPGNALNPGRGAPTRFAPIADAAGIAIPTLYAGSTRESAFHERIFHDVPLAGVWRHVHVQQLNGLMCGAFTTTRDLKLAALFRPDLALWELSREQLVHTEANQYTLTARWAEAIYREYPNIDGLVWTSHRCDPDLAYVFFGGRITSNDLQPSGEATLLLEDAESLTELYVFATRARIRILIS